MAKINTVYLCQNCGHSAAKWLGKCPSCGQWNTFVEEYVTKESTRERSKERTKENSNPWVAISI